MGKHYFLKASALVAGMLPLLVCSCVQEEYDLSDIDMTVSVGGEELVFPLGSTEKLTLKTLLTDNDYLKLTESGVYTLSMSDALDFSKELEEITDIASKLNIKPVNFTDGFEFNLTTEDVSNFTLEKQSFGNKLVFDKEQISVPDMTIPAMNNTDRVSSGLYKYYPDESQLLFNFPERTIDYTNLYDTDKVAPYLALVSSDQEVLVDAILGSATLNPKSTGLNISIELADGITSVEDMILDDNASINIAINVVNGFLTRGTIVPNIDLDLSELLRLKDHSAVISLADEFVLNESTNYSASHQYSIASLAVDQSDWDENTHTLKKQVNLTASGSVSLSNAYTSADKIAESTNAGGMEIHVVVSFADVAIKDVTMGITPIQQTEHFTVNMDIASITLPEHLAGIKEITMAHGSSITIEISNENLDAMTGLDAQISSMEIAFPKEIKSAALNEENKYVVTAGDLIAGAKYVINVDRIEPGDPVNGVISFSNTITANIVADISGKVSLQQLPKNEASDPVIVTNVSSNLVIDEYYLEIETIEQEIAQDPFEIDFDLPDGISNFGTFIITPQTNPQPVLEVDIDMPSFAKLGIAAGQGGIVINFPKLISFKEVPSEYRYNTETNSITITGELPSSIILPIDKLTVKPVLDETDNTYHAEGELTVTGNAVLVSTLPDTPGVVSGTELETLLNDGITIWAIISEMKPESIHLDEFSTDINKTFAIDLLDKDALPEQVQSIDKIELQDTKLALNIEAKNLPNMGKPAILDLSIDIPKELLINDARIDENNVLHIVEEIASDTPVEIDPIEITGLDLSGVDFSAIEGLSFDMSIDGSVYVDEPTVALSELSGTVNVNVNAGINKINISKVTGIVNYDLADVEQSIDLSSLPDFLRGDDIHLDFVNPHITLAVTSNVGIPVKGSIEINPYYNGTVNTGSAVNIPELLIPAATSAAEVKTTKYWIGDTENGKPADYVFLQAGIRNLLKSIPEKLDIKINGGTDTESTELHVIELKPSEKYQLKMDYEVAVPLQFGDELNIVMRDTLDISDLGTTVGDLLDDNSLGIGGEVISSLPLTLNLELNLLDKDKKVIPIKPATQTINACDSKGNATSSELDMTIIASEDYVAREVSGIEMKFEVTSPNFTGVPITKESYLQAILKLRVPGGVTVDLSALGTPENNEQ